MCTQGKYKSYLVPISEVSDKLSSLNTKLAKVGPYKYIDVGEYCPSDPKEKYVYIKDIKGGLTVPTLLVYSAGNNVGNFHSTYQAVPFNDVFKISQVVI